MFQENGFFEITSVHRDDSKHALNLSGEEVLKTTDDMMKEIAGKMADDYCDKLFHAHLPSITKGLFAQRDCN